MEGSNLPVQNPPQDKPTPILIAEDSRADLLLVQEALLRHGVNCQLFVARDGEKAMEFLDQVDAGAIPCPELIILDLNLPKSNGYEILARIRDRGLCMQTRVVILSSAPGERGDKATAGLGVSRYIEKPSRFDEYMQIGAELKSLLAERR